MYPAEEGFGYRLLNTQMGVVGWIPFVFQLVVCISPLERLF